MIHFHHLSSDEATYERAKAERATFIVSEAMSDPLLMPQALEGIEACERGISMLWPEFLRWELSRHRQRSSAEKSAGITFKFEPRVAPRVRDLLANLGPDDRAVFERCLAALCANPYIDNVTRFSVPYPPTVLCLNEDGPFRIVYRIVGGSVVDLLNLGPAVDVPAIAEWNDWRNN